MENNRAQWGSKIGFILAAAGSAVGLGNIWKFPGKAFEGGGGAYILIYLAIVVLIGFPVMLSELTIGRAAQANAIDSFHKLGYRGFKWVGVTGVAVAFIVTSYYCHVGGWVLRYVVSYITEAQTVYADPLGYFYGLLGYNAATGETWFPLTAILFAAVFMAVNAVIIIKGVEGGIEKFNKVGMPALFVILIVLLARTITLDGAQVGFAYMLSCDWSKVGFNTFLSALGQAFFSLSLGMAIMITYGSYTGKEVNLVRSTAMICIFDTLVALIAGLAIFPSVAHFDPALLGSSKGGARMFIILPQVFESMGGVGQVVSFAFFIMVDIAAITSVGSVIEVVTQFVSQKFHAHRKRAALIVAGVCFLVSIPIGISLGHVAILEESSPALFGLDWLTFFDEVTNTVLMPVCALFSCIVVGWFITPKRAVAEIEAGGTPMAGWLKKVYAVMIRFVTPALILIVEIGGLQSEIAAGNTAVIVFAYALVALCVAAYFLFFRNTDTGTNADEKLSGDYPV